MQSKFVFRLLIFFISICQVVWAQVPSGREIMKKVEDRPEGNTQKSVIKMNLINRHGKTRERSILLYSKKFGKDKKSVIYFQTPADVKGTGLLSWEYDNPAQEDDQWLYMPALKKSRRISGSSKNESFMGSDFTYDDFGDRNLDEDTHQFLREEALNGFHCWVVESRPKGKDDFYSKRISWIRKDITMVIQVQYYDDKDAELKKLTVSDIKIQDGIWTAFKMVMVNLQENHQTIIEFEGVQYNLELGDQLFRVSTLEKGELR
ncbi:outer membrane lipoprotein-sorting protein [candidate division KSB1 bacterium]|nr:outer membrane lipoprotein-sorting protein [candidate division KSB1 bacterium]